MGYRTKYPPIEPYKTGHLPVGSEHELYWEESGNPKGRPILFLHGGPGSGTDAAHRSYFDPDAYRIILMDQRGCGKSRPHSSLVDNTTWHLVADIELLRTFLGVEQWVVFGGSWGSTLALAYAISHPDVVSALVLRGIFLCRQKEMRWFFESGVRQIFPDRWEEFLKPIPLEEQSDLITAYHHRLTSADRTIRREAAEAWSRWEAALIRLIFDPEILQKFGTGEHADAIARIECHYFVHHAFFPTDNWIVNQVSRIRHIPAVIVHGRYDMVCPFESAWDLHKAWPEALLEIIPDAGHSAGEEGITDALLRATDRFR